MLFGVIMILIVFKIRVAPKFSYEYDIRLILGANVQNNQKNARVKQKLTLSFHSIDKVNYNLH